MDNKKIHQRAQVLFLRGYSTTEAYIKARKEIEFETRRKFAYDREGIKEDEEEIITSTKTKRKK